MKIGPSFPDELRAAGISLDGISWNPETGDVVTVDGIQAEAVDAVMALHDPRRPAPVTVLDRRRVVLNMHGLDVLKAFIASKCKATDLERWQTYDTVAVDDPVMLRMMAAATPPIDAVEVFNFTG